MECQTETLKVAQQPLQTPGLIPQSTQGRSDTPRNTGGANGAGTPEGRAPLKASRAPRKPSVLPRSRHTRMGDVNLAPGGWPLFLFMLLLTRVLTVPCGLTVRLAGRCWPRALAVSGFTEKGPRWAGPRAGWEALFLSSAWWEASPVPLPP